MLGFGSLASAALADDAVSEMRVAGGAGAVALTGAAIGTTGGGASRSGQVSGGLTIVGQGSGRVSASGAGSGLVTLQVSAVASAGVAGRLTATWTVSALAVGRGLLGGSVAAALSLGATASGTIGNTSRRRVAAPEASATGGGVAPSLRNGVLRPSRNSCTIARTT